MGKKIKVPGQKRPFAVRDREARREDIDRRNEVEIRQDAERHVPGRRTKKDDRRDDEDDTRRK
ncbi:MAG: hypothetical protein A3G18_02305 [Rhodospirillales bacterium RIFCSPLOWO2_12_FULL_58_28]|nr:MAG: hypothetical protein A3G18_02305 [Rhodospirillales bacterium RIFCSPLOWO2_12_FULL_58_28]